MSGETMSTLKKCKINFNKPLALTINNLLKPLLSKPETILIQRKYETIPHPIPQYRCSE